MQLIELCSGNCAEPIDCLPMDSFLNQSMRHSVCSEGTSALFQMLLKTEEFLVKPSQNKFGHWKVDTDGIFFFLLSIEVVIAFHLFFFFSSKT